MTRGLKMTVAALLLVGLIGVLLLGGLITGMVILASRNSETRGAFSARQDWMNSHIEESERQG